ncbi:DUF6268 family outer membrane beta-barrel protein [Mangrovibacterium marinum]|uniref:DUF6268 domain-containing protein n=1 Tax=Mangrovibacterium marinum TaxID=1639118 RepID=A0A2T5C2Q8_9BACT|nr:DUF6268 family outer membrane beta-barrel protein [Mangrovibacterium marinum]PTN09040.1 hypothetical protein C8N47_106140 [Mangrovibacterium marinum]
MKQLIAISLLLCGLNLHAQKPENYDIYLKGGWNTKSESDARFEQYGINAKLLTIPIQQGQKGVFMLRGSYDLARIDINNQLMMPHRLEQFHSAGLMLTYFKRLQKTGWSFTGLLIPQLNSNFSQSLNSNDFYLNAAALLSYSATPRSRLTFGLTYASTLGFPAPIPIISYWKSWADRWEMNLGFPRLGITRRLNDKNKLALLADLNGYNGNIGHGIADDRFTAGRVAKRISYVDVITGLEWLHKFDHYQLRLKTSYAVYRKFQLQTDDYDTAWEFDMNKGLNIGLEVGFNL